MIHYVIQTIAFQLFFLLIYDVFLKRETFFNWNRMYLIGTMILSVLLPFVKLEVFKEVIPKEYVIQLPAVIIGEVSSDVVEGANQVNTTLASNPVSYVYLLFYLGLAIAIMTFGFKLFKILKLILNSPKTSSERLVIIKLINSNSAFSFFKYVFLGEFLKDDEKAIILSHEMVHVKQYHSLDLLFFEVLRVVFWFNPLVYMYQNRITELHEYLADAEAVKYQSKQQYYQSLLAQVFQTKSISFINPFFNQTLIKKRIVMLQKSKSKHIKLLKYAFLIPAVIAILVYTSCEKQGENYSEGTDLGEFSFTMELGTKTSQEDELKLNRLHEFLIQNNEYVGWADINKGSKEVKFSIHPIEDEVPSNFSKHAMIFGDDSYLIFTNGVPVYKLNEKGEFVGSSVSFISEVNIDSVLDKVLKNEVPVYRVNGSKVIEVRADEYHENIEVPFAHVEHAPVFPGCESLESNEERKNCMSQSIAKFVNENFNTDIANSLGLEGRQRINTIFKINEEGDVVDVRARAPHPGLEEEAKRVIQLLPKMQPGKQKGYVVTVPYSLPIVFQVADKE
ncbi:M56 family metallopeptidase [Aestuariibaculum suncheonense]|uniref:Energy transducer TonB n=1 Tax=Aestuariibaculum suncheonense TaxID=1028745 RepID=A0A8J6Q497_9FLAO|nr:M56 family metallopeptidase [Aestuariibaculum suncheonense]MBD0834139.1 energy transducer TonB [Aestuariibaculum suncheonense]